MFVVRVWWLLTENTENNGWSFKKRHVKEPLMTDLQNKCCEFCILFIFLNCRVQAVSGHHVSGACDIRDNDATGSRRFIGKQFFLSIFFLLIFMCILCANRFIITHLILILPRLFILLSTHEVNMRLRLYQIRLRFRGSQQI